MALPMSLRPWVRLRPSQRRPAKRHLPTAGLTCDPGPVLPRAATLLLLPLALSACASFPRALSYRTVRSPALGETYATYAVLVPEGAEGPLPVVVFLHGGGDGPDCLDRHGVAPLLVAAMREGRLPGAIVVVPQGHLGFWANWYDGSRRYEDWVLDEVMPAVARRYRTLPCPEGCHLAGVSMGAEGALRFAVHRPGAFASVSVISGPALDTDRRIAFAADPLLNIVVPTHHVFGPVTPRSRVEEDDPFVRWQRPEDLSARLLLAWGSRDRGAVIEGSRHLDRHLTEHGIAHEAREFDGGHGWQAWGAVLVEALGFALAPPGQ